MLEAWFSRKRLRAWTPAALAVVVSLAMLPLLAGAAAAETRTLKLYNTHTHERVSITFKKNGRYLSEGLRDLNRFLRDWRRNESTKMDPALFDLVWEVYKETGATDYIHVVSAYRSPATNNMLRSRSRGVAKGSQHTRGKAMDFFIPGVNLAKLRAVALRKEVGGVGFYPTSGSPFVHLDTGTVRHWPRMTRQQLAAVFPRGDTIHVPSDGKKMPRYEEALARHSGGRGARPTQVASAPSSGPVRGGGDAGDRGITRPAAVSAGTGGPSLIARLFGSEEDAAEASDDESSAAAAPRGPTPPAPVRTQVAAAPVPPAPPAEVPPGVRSAEAATVAAAPVPAPEPAAQPAAQPAAPEAVVASVVPRAKPAELPALVAAASAGRVAPGTLEAQAQRIAAGLPPVDAPAPTAAEPAPVVVALAPPPAKPSELRQGPLPAAATAGTAPGLLPRPAPADAASAIAAATGIAPARKPQGELGGPAGALAFAPATGPAATPSSMAAASAVGIPQRRQAPPRAETGATASVAGRLPDPVIRDPLARFAALPDRSLPGLMSGRTTTRTMAFARLSHPNQRQLELLLAPGGRVYANRFATRDANAPRADRFEGPVVVLLPVVSFD